MSISILVVTCLLASAEDPPREGQIHGTVWNLSQGTIPAEAVEVELRVELDGELVPIARTRTNERGEFAFQGVPLEKPLTYVAGANVDGVHYPGGKFTLGPNRSTAYIRLNVRNALRHDNPLVIRRHEVILEPASGRLHVTEAMLVDNPTPQTYVGRAVSDDDSRSATLTLGIPPDFERITFEEEFFGRNFTLIDGTLVTNVPWEPGQRWIRFTYSIRNQQARRRWERRIDAPCQTFAVCVIHATDGGVESNLPAAEFHSQDQPTFSSSGRNLAAGELVWVGLGNLPVPWTVYARWSAVTVLGLVVAMLGTWYRFRGRRQMPARDVHEGQERPRARHRARGMARSPARDRVRRPAA
jgi:hypothetical protein